MMAHFLRAVRSRASMAGCERWGRLVKSAGMAGEFADIKAEESAADGMIQRATPLHGSRQLRLKLLRRGTWEIQAPSHHFGTLQGTAS